MVKILPEKRETWIQSLDREDPLEKGVATHSSILAWRIPWTEAPVHGVAESDTTEGISTHACTGLCCCMKASSSCSKWGLFFIVVSRLLTAVTSLVSDHRL